MPETLRCPWPAQHRAALSLVIVVDGLGNSGEIIGADYTATGLQRMIQTFADLDVASTFAFASAVLSSIPQLARSTLDLGHELAVLEPIGDEHERLWSHISDLAPEGLVRDTLSATPSTLGGSYAWRITGMGGDFPIRAAESGEGVVIPVSPYWRDDVWLSPQRPLPPSSLLEAWSLGLASMRTIGGMMTVVLHPHIAGRPGFIEQVVRFLDEAIESGDVWLATAGQVAAWARKLDSESSH
jgi:hypothetical protein